MSKRPRWDRALLRRLIRFGLPLQGNEMLTFVSPRLAVLILGAMASPAAVAYLGVATKMPQNFQRLFESLYAVYYPYMAGLFGRGEQAEAERSLNRFLRLATFVTAGSALATVLFQREIVRLVFSEKYLDSAPALGLLIGLAALGGMIAFPLAVDRPERVRSLVIVNSGPALVARPAGDWLRISDVVANEKLRVQIIGADGKLWRDNSITSNTNINTSGLPEGFYSVKIKRTNKDQTSKKLLIRRD